MRDAVAQVPYLGLTTAVNDAGCGAATRYISYDDETSIVAKGTFSKKNGYGGIIIWTIEEGWLPAGAADGRAQNALMQALKTGFIDP
jgi:chitinase